ncbi:NifU family protein [Clostridium estertheticum]|uniref:NifU family protein n=1 Tax=Clostridium estertheticum TaxID=238834 RepID=UPI001CF28AC6|nr:NifU family protein [Clostridium estertheticum]MCB2308220.1 NifU family protein [Clostridium estertheticum]MCB2346344.1 NifU family protein [Clostridium estertheticum]MCB2350885.1 NifU family protein [Clostridium estertheticum]WAG44881.1 NifU family protein [Clostridium estertheticum]
MFKEWSDGMVSKGEVFANEVMYSEIEKILESNVRPKLADHYGNIELISCDDGIVEVKLMGQCKGCLSAKYTVENLVEAVLKEAIPTIKKVILRNEVSQDLLEQARKFLNEGNRGK